MPDAYPSISAAVAAAGPGDTIRIHTGTYNEQVVVAQSGITLEPFGDGPVWIDGQCQREYGIHAEGPADYLTVRGLGIKNTIVNGIAIWPKNLPGQPIQSYITGNVITDYNCNNDEKSGEFMAGINVYYAGQGHVITGNYIKRRSALADNDPGQRGLGNGIYFKGSSEVPSGGNHIISENTIIGGYDGIGSQVEDDPQGGFHSNTVIERNTVMTCKDDGIQVEGGDVEIRVRFNRIRECPLGIASAPNIVGPLYIEDNDIRSSFVGWAHNLSCFKIGNRITNAVTYYTRNFCMAQGPDPKEEAGEGWEQTNQGMGVMVTRDNIIIAGRYVLEMGPNVSQSISPTTSMDRDCLWTRSTTRYMSWHQVKFYDLPSFQTQTGMERNGRGGAGGVMANPCQVLAEFGGATVVPTIGPAAQANPVPVAAEAPPVPTE